MIKAFDNSLKIASDEEVKKPCDKEVHQLFINNNQPEDVHDSDAIVIYEENNNNDMVDEDESEYDDEYDDEVVIQETQSINDEGEFIEEQDDDIENKDDIDSDEDEYNETSEIIEDSNEFIPDAIILQDQIININHYLDNCNDVGTLFS